MTLGTLKTGDSGVIESLQCSGPTRRRFLDIGLVPGTEITAILESFGGGPVAYRVKETHIAIRKKDADTIIIKQLNTVTEKKKNE